MIPTAANGPWWGWQTTSITQDKKSGQTPEERKFSVNSDSWVDRAGGWIAKNLYKLSVKINPIAKLGDAIGYKNDQVTGEYKDPARARLQAAEAVFEIITLGRGKIAENVVGKYVMNKLKDYGYEQIITIGLKSLGAEKTGILIYHIIRLVQDGNTDKLKDIYKFIAKGASIDGKIMDAEKQLKENFGIDLNPPKDGNAAVEKALNNLGEDSGKIKK